MLAVAEKEIAKPVAVQPRMTPKLTRLLASERYCTPSVISFPLKGVVATGQVSMIGNV